MSPLSLYLHLPWCVRKCPYCDFNSHESKRGLPEDRYVNALLNDLDSELENIAEREIQTIYFGGGTPSLFSAESVDRLLKGIRARVRIRSGVEITLEANPGAVDMQRFADYRKSGVNRLSVGVQSFSDDALQKLGRVHDAKAARAAVRAALDVGFSNVNIDLMYGLPNARRNDAISDLNAAIELGAQHISWYHLTLEPGTAFYRRPPSKLPEDAAVIEVENLGREILMAAGYGRYEVSAYAQPECQSQHNLNYWQFGDYIGLGAGAHSKLSDPDGYGFTRYAKRRNPESYMQLDGRQRVEVVERIEQTSTIVLEYLMNALRTTTGARLNEFEKATRLDRGELRAFMAAGAGRGWLQNSDEWLVATDQGLRNLNQLLLLAA